MKVVMVAPDISIEKGIAIYSDDLISSIKKAGINIRKLSYTGKSFLSFLKMTPTLFSYDIVHIQHEYKLFGSAGIFFIPLIIIIGLLRKGKLIITMHTVLSKKEKLLPDIFWWSWLKKNVIYPIENKLIELFSSKIIVHADFLANILVKDYNINKKKIVVIPHGIKDNVPSFEKRKAKAELNLSGNIYLLMGTIARIKGIDIILKLAKKIGKTIVIAGHSNFKINADYIEELQNYIKNNNLNNLVKFETREMDSNSRLWWLYFSAADLILMPYRSPMTTSGIFNDAMAYRKPVIASNRRFFREVFKKFKCLKIAKKNTDYPKLIRYVMKPKILAKMEKECKRYAQKYSLSAIGKKYKSLYESLV